MKRFLALLLFVMLALTLVFSFAACQQDPEKLKSQLISSVEKASTEPLNFEATVTGIACSDDIATAKILGYGSEGNYNVDAYIHEGIIMRVCMWRNGISYVTSIDVGSQTAIAPENLQAEVEKLAYNNPEVLFTRRDDILDIILDSFDAVGVWDYVSVEDLEKMPESSATLAHNLLSLVFSKMEQTDDGYLLSMDLNKLFEDLWTKIYAVATAVDENPKITISELYATEQVQEILSLFLDGVTGKQMQDLLEYVGENLEVTLPYEILPAKNKESATDYLGRYLETIKVGDTVTLGSIRISDWITTSHGDAVDYTDFLDKIKPQLDEELSDNLEIYECELRFNKRKKLVGIKFVMNCDGLYKKITLEANLLDKQPKLLDTTKLNSIALSDVKINKCADKMFWLYENYDKKYLSLTDGDLSASIYTIQTADNTYRIWLKNGNRSVFRFEMSKVEGQWVVEESKSYLNYSNDFDRQVDYTYNENSILVNYVVKNEIGMSLLDFNFTINFETLSH